MDCKTANRMMVPFLEGALSLEETDHFLKHIKECSGCREDLEIYYTVRTAIDGMDQDRFKTYNLIMNMLLFHDRGYDTRVKSSKSRSCLHD